MIEAMKGLDDFGTQYGGMNINNLRFADFIDLIGKDQNKVQELTSRPNNASKKFGMEISKGKSKTMVLWSDGDNIRLQVDIDESSTLEQKPQRAEHQKTRSESELELQPAQQ